jgi:hypothetical protein
LNRKDLSSWDFSGQNLTNARLASSNLTNADLSGANLANALLASSALTNADLTGTDLKNANLRNAYDLSSATVSANTHYNQWTVFPSDFDPAAAGLTHVISPIGDLIADDTLNAADIDTLVSRIDCCYFGWLPDEAFDMNGDNSLDLEDHRFWVKDLKHTWYGDADLDGKFGSNDIVQVFRVGKYETKVKAGWSEGDWNGDGVFNTGDFVTAFIDGGFETGPRTDAAVVPEPEGCLLWVIGLLPWLYRRTARSTA